MRTFIAIPLPADSRTMLQEMQNALRIHGAEVGWVAVPSIHLTLRFLGEIDPELVPQLAQSLETAAAAEKSFALKLCGLGCFPGLRSPRVIWCGIEGDTGALLRLQQKVEQACGELGFPPEKRAFKPHLRLGRVKGKRNLQPLIECIKMSSGLEHAFRADHFNIYRSTLKPQGAVYTVLKTVPLRD